MQCVKGEAVADELSKWPQNCSIRCSPRENGWKLQSPAYTTGMVIMNHAVSPLPYSPSSRKDCAKNRSSISYEIETTIPQSVRVLKLLESDLDFAKNYVSSLLAKLRKTSGLLLQQKRNLNQYELSIQNLIPS